MIVCEICHGELAAAAPNYRLVVGWEQIRGGGGANKITRRAELGRWAHRDCVENPTRPPVLFDPDDVPPSLLERKDHP